MLNSDTGKAEAIYIRPIARAEKFAFLFRCGIMKVRGDAPLNI